jgi:hypothetical protein
LTKLKSQSQKRFNERKYQYKNKNHSGTDTSKLSDINLVPNLNFCAKYDRGLDLGFWELLKPLKWTNIQTGLFYTTNPVFYTSGNRFVHRTGMFGNL